MKSAGESGESRACASGAKAKRLERQRKATARWKKNHPDRYKELARKAEEKRRETRSAANKLRRTVDPEFVRRSSAACARWRAKQEGGYVPKIYKARQVALRIVKESLGCEKCGSRKHLEWHHRDPKQKLFSVTASTVGVYTVEEQWAELRKCDLLCKSCHTRVHRKGRRGKVPRNSRGRYVAQP